MTIIAGRWGGRTLPKKVNPKMRPTTGKVKEAIFDILESRVVDDWKDKRVLDLFSGSGAFGLEALSRGAPWASFVDSHLKATKVLQETLKDFEVQNETEVICKGTLDAITWLHRKGQSFDLIFLDPPYRQDWVVATLNRLHEAPILQSKGIVVAEHDKRESLSTIEGFWKVLDARRYGDTMISFLCPIKSKSYWENKFKRKTSAKDTKKD